jgi:hypothetical protein
MAVTDENLTHKSRVFDSYVVTGAERELNTAGVVLDD